MRDIKIASQIFYNILVYERGEKGIISLLNVYYTLLIK